ncbi:TetR/AcrR family transcriptional regulator, partial [Rhizobium ruizarguesonis]
MIADGSRGLYTFGKLLSVSYFWYIVMSSAETTGQPTDPQPRRRLSRQDRHRQLLDVAWQIARDEGTEAL